MTRVALLWHMHQPYYEDLVTREHILPWVRLHALKDYYGMAALLEEFPDVRVTFNLVPSLLVQLEAFAEGRAHDRYLEVGLRPADQLTPDDRAFILKNFFHAQRARMIDVYPRYAELLAKRGLSTAAGDIDDALRRYTVDDFRDLQVWQKLAWIDPYYFDRDVRVQALAARGRGFSEDDKGMLRAVELELLNAVIPTYRRLASAGQIEIATSPFYHPILPLLCDTDIYKHTHPQSRMPRQRFQRPEDAREQLVRAADCHERLFGARPVGLWPSEGSVSDQMVPLAAAAGFRWMATDEQILANSLGTTFSRDGAGFVNQPARLYAAYDVGGAEGRIACGFRDHALSDLIGFAYSGWDAEEAAGDFVAKLAESGRRAQQAGASDPVVFVILDGENAWEHFAGQGRPFLRALYRRLGSNGDLRTVTMAEACAAPVAPLPTIFPGSWIDANYYIWIGHQDDHRAWSQLGDARDALDAPNTTDPVALARAREEIFIAEGSDWFWWYGDDHSSDHDLEFDDLFRRHLRNVYGLLNRPVPDELFATNISGGARLQPQRDPTQLLTPRIDGVDGSYFEWLGAGSVAIKDVAGAMHQVERQGATVAEIGFGFDRSALYVRVDGVGGLAGLVAQGASLGVICLSPEGLRYQFGAGGTAKGQAIRLQRHSDDRWHLKPTEATFAVGAIFEASIPWRELLADGSASISFFVTVHDAAGLETERHPAGRPVVVTVPDASFEARHWSA